MYDFTKHLASQLRSAIDESLENINGPAIAAFDADGTLWATDMGESFFNYQIKNRLLKQLPESPWQYYVDFNARSPEASFLWLAQINRGIELNTVRKWAAAATKSHPDMGLFSGQKKLIRYLQERDVEIFVVTASVAWAVEPAAALYEIPHDHVIGVRTKVVNGIITDEQDGPMTYKEGKVTGLLAATSGAKPFFVAGNTTGDLALLESATNVRLVLASAPKGHRNFSSEQKMQAIARERGWLRCSW